MSDAAQRWIVRRPRERPADWRLICLPHAGSGAAAFAAWFAAAPPDCEVVIARLPGRENRLAEPVPDSIAAVIDGLLPAVEPLLDRPYVVFGYSMGALMAFELTRRLVRDGQRLPVLLAVGGHEAPHLPRWQPPIHQLPRQEFIASLRELGGTPDVVFETPELLDLLIPTLRADLRLVETYGHDAIGPLPVPIATYVGAGDDTLASAGLAAWDELSTAATMHHSFAGGHFFLSTSGRELLSAIVSDAEQLRVPPAG